MAGLAGMEWVQCREAESRFYKGKFGRVQIGHCVEEMGFVPFLLRIPLRSYLSFTSTCHFFFFSFSFSCKVRGRIFKNENVSMREREREGLLKKEYGDV